MKRAVFGLVKNADHADRIISRLLQSGFRNDEISVILTEEKGKFRSQEPGFERRGNAQDFETLSDEPRANVKRGFEVKKGTLAHEKHTKAPEGAAGAATAGGIIGGSIGLLAGLGSLAIPGLGVFVAAGPILAALSGSAVGGAVGLFVGALVGLGIPEYEAKKYETELKKGNGVLLCVHAEDSKRVEKAKEILEKEGAKDIATSREKASR